MVPAKEPVQNLSVVLRKLYTDTLPTDLGETVSTRTQGDREDHEVLHTDKNINCLKALRADLYQPCLA